jgi:hypothetical protein
MFTEQMVIQTDWQQLLRNKYLRTMSLTQVGKKPGDSILDKLNERQRSIPNF